MKRKGLGHRYERSKDATSSWPVSMEHGRTATFRFHLSRVALSAELQAGPRSSSRFARVSCKEPRDLRASGILESIEENVHTFFPKLFKHLTSLLRVAK